MLKHKKCTYFYVCYKKLNFILHYTKNFFFMCNEENICKQETIYNIRTTIDIYHFRSFEISNEFLKA